MSRQFSELLPLGHTGPTGRFDGGDINQVLPWCNGNGVDHLKAVRKHMGNDVMFTLERNFNQNTLLFRAKRNSDNIIDSMDPVDIEWLMIPRSSSDDSNDESDDDEHENGFRGSWLEAPLLMERHLAYGCNVLAPNVIEIRACKGLRINITITTGNRYIALVNVDDNVYQLQRILIHTVPNNIKPWPKTVQLDVWVLDTDGGQHEFYYKVPA